MGLAADTRQLAATGLLLVRQRVELAALDVEDELAQLAGLFARIVAVALLAALALAFASAAVLIAFWDSARLAAACAVAFAWFAATVLAWRQLLRAWAAKPPFMQATLEELRRDGRELEPRA